MRRATVVLAGVALLATGCHIGRHKTIGVPGPDTTITHSLSPDPTKTVIKRYPTYPAGATATINVPQEHASLTITAGAPSKSTTRLSPTYGYAPSHGYYVTFPLTIKNTGQASLLIERLDFYVKTPGLGKITTNDGNLSSAASE